MVSPDMTKLRWFRGRRLDKIKTTAGDTYEFYCKSRRKLSVNNQAYDHACADFGTIAGTGDNWEKAKKDHTLGEFALNTAFKMGMLIIYYDPDDIEDESAKLVDELESLAESTDKKVAKDDFIDSLRYAVTGIPIDWDEVFNGEGQKPSPEDAKKGTKEKERPNDYYRDREEERKETESIQDEIDEWVELY